MKLKIIHFLSFFSTNAVKSRIVNAAFPEGLLFLYFYIDILYDSVSFVQECIAIAGKQPSTLDWVNIWGYLIFTAVGLIIVFFANGALRGRNFLMKYFPLSFTVGFKYGVAYLILNSIPMLIPQLESLMYGASIFIILNVLMVANISYQIYSIR